MLEALFGDLGEYFRTAATSDESVEFDQKVIERLCALRIVAHRPAWVGRQIWPGRQEQHQEVPLCPGLAMDEFVQALRQLGINVFDAQGELREIAAIFYEIMAQMANQHDSATCLTLARQIFGQPQLGTVLEVPSC